MNFLKSYASTDGVVGMIVSLGRDALIGKIDI